MRYISNHFLNKRHYYVLYLYGVGFKRFFHQEPFSNVFITCGLWQLVGFGSRVGWKGVDFTVSPPVGPDIALLKDSSPVVCGFTNIWSASRRNSVKSFAHGL